MEKDSWETPSLEWLHRIRRANQERRKEQNVISVVVYINHRPIVLRAARRTKEYPDGTNEYTVDDGRILRHRAKDGAIPLAIALLEGVKDDPARNDTR